MAFIPGYRLAERIYASDNSLVFRAVRDADGMPVILKILKNDFPTVEELARYRREFDITSAITVPGVAQGYDMQRHEKTVLMVLEDFGGISVAELLRERRMALDEFFEAAVQVAEALQQIHRARVIHKDISPQNIVINPSTGEVKLIDFGIATRFSTERPVLRSPEVLEGTIAYMSPEQTGRMNRSLDHRTDFYSLGATFYEMLCGQPPFRSDDLMELVHCHIAREPTPLQRRDPDIPLPLSKVVSKLMAKKAEDRYQSAQGLLADLEALRQGVGTDRFEPGRNDHTDHFHIPERLYGREREVARLLETFERTRQGPAELMLVAGYSGVGKSALVNEVHKPITRARGYFIAGKFDQYQRNVPYSGLLAALKDLVRQLLTESEERLSDTRQDINDALAPNGQVMVDLLPELELVIGAQPAVPDLTGAQAMARFHRVIGQFLNALTSRERVIVMFLDDLQWADSATLNLLRYVFSSGDARRLLIIGAYRDNEVDAMHPLNLALKDIEQTGSTLSTINLAPLGLPDIGKLLSDTLHADPAELTGLARLVLQKTQGNPLFVRQFLMDLHREGFISRSDPGTVVNRSKWEWNLQAIRSAGITDNVVDLLLRRLRLLMPETQEALRIAACIGNRFDIDTLALMLKTTDHDAFEAVRPAIEEELVRAVSELTTSEVEDVLSPLVVREMRFQHDRVQQAAYALIDEDERKDIHLAIGRRLLDTLSPGALSDRLFEVVDHLDIGSELITDPAERRVVAALNLRAAQKATESTAYAAALSLVKSAQALLGASAWDDDYGLACDAYRQRAALEYLNGNYETCAEVIAETLENVRTDLERAQVYFTRIIQLTMIGEFQAAIDAGYKTLALLGVDMPRDDLVAAGEAQIGDLVQRLEGRSAASLYDSPEATAPEVILAQQTLRHLTIAAFIFNQELWPLVVGTSVKLSLEHGNTSESALSYANYGLILGAAMQRYSEGYEFGQLALRLCDRYKSDAPVATICLVVGSELVPWVEHSREALPVIDRGIQAGLDDGDILWVSYLIMYRVLLENVAGQRIEDVLDGIPERLAYTDQTQNPGASAGIRAHQIVLSTLAGQTQSSADFSGPDIDEAAFLAGCEEQHLSMAICLYKVLKAQALYLFGRAQEALEATLEIEDKLAFIVNHPNLADHRLYQSLAVTALYPSGDAERDAQSRDRLDANRGMLKVWADASPDNFRAKYLIVEAEVARISDDAMTASDLYDQAIDAAHSSRMPQDEALANELAARFVMETRPKSRIGAMYLRDAHYAYRYWGATRKVEELEMEFPQLLTEYREQRAAPATTLDLRRKTVSPDTTQSGGTNIDIETLIKAGQTISGEVVLSRLLDRLLTIVMENAGAQRGLLMLAQGEGLNIAAESDVAAGEANVQMSLAVDSEEGRAMVPSGVVNYAARTREMVVLDEATQDERFMNDSYVQKYEVRSLLCQPILNQGELIGLIYLENNLSNAVFTPDRAHLVALLSGQIAISIRNAELVENLEEKVQERTGQLEMHSRFIEQTFGRYLSSQIVDRLLKSPDGLDFLGRTATVTIMSADLRGFTAFSDSLPPETIVKLLNNYLSEMTTIIEKYNGTIDAFVGDSILTMFGVPFQRPDDAERAIACALEMQMAMPRVNAWNAKNGLPDLEMGIGINTGEVVVGNIGSHKRAKYGVVGRNVNLAARVEGYTVGGQVLITQEARNAVATPMTVHEFGTVEPKGVLQPVTLYEVKGLSGRYDLALPVQDTAWNEVAPAVPVRFRRVVDKKVTGASSDAELTALSGRAARIKSASDLTKFDDLQLELRPADGSGPVEDIYAKVMEADPDSGTYVLGFTATPPEALATLRSLAQCDATPAV